MPDRSPSTQRRFLLPWDQILLGIVEGQGADILTRVLQNKARLGSSPPTPPVTPSDFAREAGRKLRAWTKDPLPYSRSLLHRASQAANRARTEVRPALNEARLRARARLVQTGQSLRQLVEGPDRMGPVRQAALEFGCGAGYSVGFVVGFQLPQLDLSFTARGRAKDNVVLHSAALLGSEVAIEWAREVLQRTLLAPTLGPESERLLRAALRMLDACSRGLHRGWSSRQVARAWVRFWSVPGLQTHRVVADPNTLRMLASAIEKLRAR